MNNKYLVIFDGVCNFCNGAVQFIIARDPSAKFIFMPMQSELAEHVLSIYGLTNTDNDTLLLLDHNQSYDRTNAALQIAGELTGYWYCLKVFRIVPRPIRDWCYRMFARNRYALFGRATHCKVPNAEIRARFVGLEKYTVDVQFP